MPPRTPPDNDAAPHHPLKTAAQQLADDTLFPLATEIDQAALITRDHLAPLADAGLMALAGPPDDDTPPCSAHDGRAIAAALAGGCAPTFFVWAQHQALTSTIASGTNGAIKERYLHDLCAGTVVGGAAFAHLRRTDRDAVTATPDGDGWVLHGFAPWATSWGIASVFTIGTVTPDGGLVWVLIDGSEQAGLSVHPFRLPVLNATGTVALALDGLRVPADAVISTSTVAEWRANDRAKSAYGQTGIMGIAARAISLLRATSRSAGDSLERETADVLDAELDALWRADAVFVDDYLTARTNTAANPDDPPFKELTPDWYEAATAHRAACLHHGQRATMAFLAASGGGGMSLSHTAQRLCREANFFVIQAQTPEGRTATLRSIVTA